MGKLGDGPSSLLCSIFVTSVISNYFTVKKKKMFFKNKNNIMPLCNVCKLVKMNQFMIFAVRGAGLPGEQRPVGDMWEHLCFWLW